MEEIVCRPEGTLKITFSENIEKDLNNDIDINVASLLSDV